MGKKPVKAKTRRTDRVLLIRTNAIGCLGWHYGNQDGVPDGLTDGATAL